MTQHHHNELAARQVPGLGQVKLVKNCWDVPIDIRGASDCHHLELTLLDTSQAAVRFVDHWRAFRFERLGQLFFLPAEQTVHARSQCREQISVICSIDPGSLESRGIRSLEWQSYRMESILNIASPRMRGVLQKLSEELSTPDFGSDTMIELLALQATIELSRYLNGQDENLETGGLPLWRLRLIEERLIEQSMPPSLKELATLCQLSVRHLSRAFRISRGCSIGSYIAEHRMHHAKRMLSEGQSVKAVAYQAGFAAPSNFSAAFLRSTGETPSRYQSRTKQIKFPVSAS